MQTYNYGLKALYARFGASMDVSKADYVARTAKPFLTHPEAVKHQQEQAGTGQRPQLG